MKELSSDLIFDGTDEDFENIVNSNKLLLYSIVYGISGGYDADDIVQETFIYAYYHFGMLKDRTKLSSWLSSIARNKAYDNLKRAGRTVSIDNIGDSASYINPENSIIKKEESGILKEQIANLSDKYRECTMLYYFAEKSVKDIANILSIPEGTVKFRLSESRRILKKELFGMLDKEKKIIKEKDIFAKIKKETSKAYIYINNNDTRSASELCDDLIAEVEKIDIGKLSKDELFALYGLYSAKASAIKFAEGGDAFLRLLKKLLEIAEATEDNSFISGTYSFYASCMSNLGNKEEASRYYEMAFSLAKASSDDVQFTEQLFWKGIDDYRAGNYEIAALKFKKILDMKSSLFENKENKRVAINNYALAYSAYNAIKKAGNKINELTEFYTCAPSIKMSNNGYSLAGEPGFTSNDQFGFEIFYAISKMKPFISNKINVGYTFEQNTFSYSHMPVISYYEVISMDEKYHTPSKDFDNCLHIRVTNSVPDDGKATNKRTNGVTDIWYAPYVGVAGIEFYPLQGNRKCVRLKEYKIVPYDSKDICEKYLPLYEGNIWSYEFFDKNDSPASITHKYLNSYEVVSVSSSDKIATIAHYGFAYKK